MVSLTPADCILLLVSMSIRPLLSISSLSCLCIKIKRQNCISDPECAAQSRQCTFISHIKTQSFLYGKYLLHIMYSSFYFIKEVILQVACSFHQSFRSKGRDFPQQGHFFSGVVEICGNLLSYRLLFFTRFLDQTILFGKSGSLPLSKDQNCWLQLSQCVPISCRNISTSTFILNMCFAEEQQILQTATYQVSLLQSLWNSRTF